MLIYAVGTFTVCWIICVLFGLNQSIVFRVKWTIAYAVLWTLKRRKASTFSHDVYSRDIYQVGVGASPESWIKESPQALTSNRNDADDLGFWGVDNYGNALITRITRRNDRNADVMMYMKLASGEEYQLPIQPGVRVVNTDGKAFSACGLTYELLEPLKRWRVSFNGLLRKSSGKTWSTNDQVVTVRFSFMWIPLYFYRAIPDDFNLSVLAANVAKMKWTSHILRTCSLILAEEWYEQSGELHGTMTIQDDPEFKLLLRGHKDRKHSVKDTSLPERGITIKGYLKYGLAFHLSGEEHWLGLDNFVNGYMNHPSNFSVDSISNCSLNVTEVLDDPENSKDIVLHFKTEFGDYLLLAKETDFGFTVYLGDNWEQEVTTKLVTVKLNDKVGFGFVEYRRPNKCPCLATRQASCPLLADSGILETTKLLVSFADGECRSSQIVGGKGASLGLLTSVSMNETENFVVPQGFCITNQAFQLHLNDNPKVVDAIHKLEDVAWKRKVGSIPDECAKVVEAMLATKTSEKLKKELQHHFKTDFPKLADESFAIRSSAIGEDSEELSAAGQNETYLGVKGLSEILKAIVKCWASQFSFRSVEYRRQYGQLLNGGMGVVVQLMVPSDIAGVLFSRDPRTGSPAYMTITSNYGLGESVVAAAADPDTIVLKRSWNDKLSIHQKDIGKKNMKIVMSESGGTLESAISNDESSKCTLSDELCIKLGQVAIYLEKCFGNARDNEWAVHNNQIYLLQSRPVTSDSPLTDFEVLHEFEPGFKTDYERYTTANIGEVFPAAITPLTMTGVLRAMGNAFAKKIQNDIFFGSKFDPSVQEGIITFYNHSAFDRIAQKMWNFEKTKSGMTQAMELGFFGRVIDDEETVRLALERFRKPPFFARFMMTSFSLRGIVFGFFDVKKAERTFRNYTIPMDDTKTPMSVYKRIEEHMLNIDKVVYPHMGVSFASTVWNLLLLNILSSGRKEFDLEHYSDFALLIGSCNGTESGGLPYQLQELAEAISMEMEGKQFSSMSPEDAMKWLLEKTKISLEKFKEFLRRHGHRAYKEFDMRTVTWEMDPLRLVITLQQILKNPSSNSTKDTKGTASSVQSSIAKMKTPITNIQKKFLALILYLCRKYVCYRERTKSMMINFHHSLRKSYHNLAKLMVESGVLPDPDLLFFLTHEEIGILIQTRSPRLIRRARRRCHHYEYMNSLHFPEMIDGYPTPIEEKKSEITDFEGLTQVKGYPACMGVVQGVARVINSFDEVETINRGEILITYCTDIGWSPYFPLLSGVVTEIGGLISHGAVVAREYGLPCLISAENATRVFKSGDIVKLDATKGILLKIK